MVLGRLQESIDTIVQQFIDRQLSIVNNPNFSPRQRMEAKKLLTDTIDKISNAISQYNQKHGVKP